MKPTSNALVLLTLVCAAACSQGPVDDNVAHHDDPSTDVARTGAPTTQSPKAAIDPLAEGFVRVPNGVIAHRDCIHVVPNGAEVDANGNVTIAGTIVAHHDECASPIQFLPRIHEQFEKGPVSRERTTPTGRNDPPALSNWIEATWQNAPANQQFTALHNTFVVPQPPTTKNDGQIVYMFPSVQNAGTTAIVQPVLQWGVFTGGTKGSGSGGSGGQIGSSASWTYAAWGVTASSVYVSPGITVNSGDTIRADMQMTKQSGGVTGWAVVASDDTTKATSGMTVAFNDVSLWNNAQAAVLEAYGIVSCNDFPSDGLDAFKYPSMTEWNPSTGAVTQVSPSTSGWVAKLASNGTLVSGYTGPSCGFGVTMSDVAHGTTISY